MRWIYKEFLKENLAPNQAGKVTLVSVNVKALLALYKLNTVHHLQYITIVKKATRNIKFFMKN